MGSAKELMMMQEAAQNIGIGIAVRAGVLEVCEMHGHCYWVTGEDEAEAYKLASAMIRDGDDIVEGMDRETVLDGVKAAIGDAGIDGCSHCAKNMED